MIFVLTEYGRTVNDMRLIDAKRMESNIKEAFKENPFLMGMLLRWVRKQPTIDAVPVVRCRDCKYGSWDSEPHDAMVCIRCGLDGWYSGDSFCSYGVRKDSDSDGS